MVMSALLPLHSLNFFRSTALISLSWNARTKSIGIIVVVINKAEGLAGSKVDPFVKVSFSHVGKSL